MSINNKNFKIIGLCYSGISNEYQAPLFNSIIDKCANAGYKVLIFASFSNKYTNSKHDIGEHNIYSLINYDMLDGMIILGATFKNSEVLNNIIFSSLKSNIPLISIDYYVENAYNIEFDYTDALYKITNHFIKEHNCTKINFISGGFDNEYTDKRLNAYKMALKDNNLPFEKNRVLQGMFWHENASDAVTQYLENNQVPDAFVCANDSMAIGAILALETQGYKVPDDVLVSGFDGITEATEHTPKITTARYDFEYAAELSVKTLDNYFNGVINDLNRYAKHVTKISSDMTSCDTLEQAAVALQKYCKNAWTRKLWICLRNDLFETYDNYDEYDSKPAPKPSGYPEYMNLYIKKEFDENQCLLGKFKTKELLPDLYKNLEKYNCIHFMPLHSIDQTTGYLAREISPAKEQAFEKWHSFCINVSNAVSALNTQSNLQYAIKMLEKVYNRDPLTGLYNRLGFYQELETLFSSNPSGYIAIFSMDLDNLKPINDKYGHDEGDRVLKDISEALMHASSNGEICSRFGGDEFIVACGVKCSTMSNDYTNQYLTKLNDFIRNINESSQRPYVIDASVGVVVDKCCNISDIESLIRIADKRMYSNKETKKSLKN